MKKITLLLCSLFFIPVAFSQEHFSGISTSKRVGILNVGNNPSELANLNNKIEVQLFAASISASSNKVGFSDIVDGEDLEELIFAGNKSVNFSMDAEIAGPGVALKLSKWGFAITSKAHIKANIIDVDPELGDALINGDGNSLLTTTILNNKDNQRVNATTWGEVGLSAARKVFENDKHRINAGATLKFLFPGSYANIGVGQLGATITNTAGDFRLNDANANINIAYSGSFANSFTDASDYTSSIFGNLKGMAVDIGADYQWKGNGKSYKLKVGAALKNIGSMTFKSNDNYSTNYALSIHDATGLDLNEFDNAESIKDVEGVFIAHPEYFTETSQSKDFKVKLPTVFNLYADVNVISKLNVTLFLQQKVNDDNGNDQITSQNSFSVTPRVTLGFFEAYIPVSFNEISGTAAGFGFRLGGFFLGSNSILTAVTSDSKQADLYFGFRFGI